MALRTAESSTRYELSKGRPDIRKWPVEAEGGRRIGTVHDFVVDEEHNHMRYLDVDLADRDDRVLVPVGHARVDRDEKRVRLPGVGHEGLRDVPAWSGRTEELDRDYERRLGESWDKGYGDRYHRRPDYASESDRDTDWKRRSGKLARLDELDDYKVADHEHDPRGWAVVDRDGKRIGRVDHLIGDTGIMKIQYFVVDLKETPGLGDRHVLVPAGHVRLNTDDENVVLESMGMGGFSDLPAYGGTAPSREEEERVGRAWRDASTGEYFYRHPRYRESSLWGDRTTGRS